MARPVTQKGTAWKVTARGVPCSFALKEAKRMVKTPFKGEAGTKLTQPEGLDVRGRRRLLGRRQGNLGEL